jgi:two-component system sensor histidine kinase DctS
LLRLMRRDGERFDALLYEAPLIDADGRHTGWMASVLDITERKQARERTRQQEEKLAATARLITMGEMASALAHELNQPLAAIAGYTAGSLNLLRAGGPGPAGLEEALGKTAQQAQRAGQIIRRVHEFVRQREPTRVPVRLNSTVEEALGFAEAEARKRQVRISVRLAEDDPELQADPVLLQQVLLNLLRNGMDAMAATPAAERHLQVSVVRADAAVTVAVADRGCGLTPQVRDQMFQPFFTTKAEGMGMGLHICRSIMETTAAGLPRTGWRRRGGGLLPVVLSDGPRGGAGAGGPSTRDDDGPSATPAWPARGLTSRTWPSAEAFLGARPAAPGCLRSTSAWTG